MISLGPSCFYGKGKTDRKNLQHSELPNPHPNNSICSTTSVAPNSSLSPPSFKGRRVKKCSELRNIALLSSIGTSNWFIDGCSELSLSAWSPPSPLVWLSSFVEPDCGTTLSASDIVSQLSKGVLFCACIGMIFTNWHHQQQIATFTKFITPFFVPRCNFSEKRKLRVFTNLIRIFCTSPVMFLNSNGS